MTTTTPRLFCFGLGYSAGVLATTLKAARWSAAGTCQDADRRDELEAAGIETHLFDRNRPLDDAPALLAGVTHLLSSVPTDGDGDAVLDHHTDDIRRIGGLRWAGYLSSTAVYGDTGGSVVDETASLAPTSDRARRRLEAENGWLALWHRWKLPVHIFRLSGIYGPGRSALDRVWAGKFRIIDKPAHRFGRIHVEDIANILKASMERPRGGAVYNVSDDLPAAAADVIAFACRLLGVTPPPAIPFDRAVGEMSPMERSFWRDDRLIDNTRIKEELGVRLKYSNYESGLKAILECDRFKLNQFEP